MAQRRVKESAQEAAGQEHLTEASQVRFLLVDRGARVAEVAVRYGFVALIFYFVTACVGHLAGQRTMADIGVRVLADVKFSEAVAWIFGVGGVGYGMSQRRLRRKEVGHLGKRLRRYEVLLDPWRSSMRSQDYGEE